MTGEVPLINGLLVLWFINGNYVNYYGLLMVIMSTTMVYEW